MRWIIMTCILMTCLLGGCSQKENVDNSYFEENYEISETTLNLKSLSLNEAFSIQEQDKQSNFILIIIDQHLHSGSIEISFEPIKQLFL